jgi:hypothetical protein
MTTDFAFVGISLSLLATYHLRIPVVAHEERRGREEQVSGTVLSSWIGLVDDLIAEGVAGEQWRAAFLEVPREVFIPEVIWREAGDELVPLRRGDELGEWLRRVYGPGYVVTQVDDGSPAGAGGCGRMVTSSASCPDIVALMLDAGRVEWSPPGTAPTNPLGCCR